MATAISRWAVTHTYEDVQKLIAQTVRRFQKRYGGDFKELQAQANLCFMENYHSHDAERAQFTTWLVYKTWRQLQGQLRRDVQVQKGKHTVPMPEELSIEDRRHFDVEAFIAELSEDARTLAELALDLPMDIVLSMKSREEKRGDDKLPLHDNIRGALVEFLWDFGWSTQRIGESFQEIGEALLQRR